MGEIKTEHKAFLSTQCLLASFHGLKLSQNDKLTPDFDETLNGIL
jgi:hypothetical protein